MQIRSLSIAIVALLLITSCTDDKPSSGRTIDRPSLDKEAPAIRVKLKNKGTIYYGDTLQMDVEPLKSSLSLKNVTVEVVDDKSFRISSKDGHLKIPTQATGGGDFQLKIKAEFEDGSEGSRYKSIQVLAKEPAKSWNLEVLERYPHDGHSYTQGLLVYDGYIYEGTGTYGGSHLRKLDLKTGEVLQEKELSSDFFGEGITIFDGKIYQLTYKASRGFIYDLKTFEKTGDFTYTFNTTEGWGLTNNDTALVASDGSSMLYFIHPENFSINGYLRVFDENGSVEELNELEYYNGIIYANIYTTARIVAIDPKSGRVLNNYFANGIVLKSETTANMDVLNGIAFNPLNGNFLITGKNWSKLYEVRPIPGNS